MNFPSDLKYTSHDEWLRIDGDTAVLGISDYAQDALGEIVYIELPEAGDTFAAGDAICEVESVKAVAEVYTPVACEVIEVNEGLDGDEAKVNSDPYGDGWIMKVRITDDAGVAELMDAAAYGEKIAAS